MINEQLINFVMQSRQAGTPEDQIREQLTRNGGWSAQDIQEAFDSIKKRQTFVSNPDSSTHPKKYLKFLTTLVILGIFFSAYYVSAQFGLVPGFGVTKSVVLNTKPVDNKPPTQEVNLDVPNESVQINTQVNNEVTKPQSNPKSIKVTGPIDNTKTNPTTTSSQLKIPSDWKTYQNSEYGFEFKYPNGHEVSSDYQYIYVKDPKTTLTYTFTVLNNTLGYAPEGYVRLAISEPGLNRNAIKEIMVNDLEGVEVTLQSGNIENRSLYFGINDKMINIQYHLDNDYFVNRKATAQKELYIKNGEMLVSTFKVTRSATSFSGTSPIEVPLSWKTYRNDKYAFEVKYPPDWTLYANTYPVDSFGISSPEREALSQQSQKSSGDGVIGEIGFRIRSKTTNPIGPPPDSTMKLGNIAVNKYLSTYGNYLIAGYIITNDNEISFSITGSPNEKTSKILDQMLSSFKLTK